LQATEHKKKENWDEFSSTLNTLIKIQPNFVKVWDFQAHNLSYNVSVEFDDYEQRYYWVKEGIKFLTKGIPYNIRDHRITDRLGFTTGMKIGRSDERFQFRRMFRVDREFHDEMWLDGKGIEPDSYYSREYQHDNWKMAYQWYVKSRNLVENGADRFTNEMMFYRNRPMQLINQAGILQDEFRTDEAIQETWRAGNEEWVDYGRMQIHNTLGQVITYEGMSDLDYKLTKLREQLDELVPNVRNELVEQIRAEAGLTPQEEDALRVPIDERTDEELALAQKANQKLLALEREIDATIAARCAEKDRATVRRIVTQIQEVLAQMQFVVTYADTVNYKYWKTRTAVEAEDEAARARQAMYDASEMKRRSIFDDEYELNYKTREKTIVKVGAISKYEEAFRRWKSIIDQHTELGDKETADDIMAAANDYYDILRISGVEWPDDFPLQSMVDAQMEVSDGTIRLPTSEEIAERRSGRDEEYQENSDDNHADSPKTDSDSSNSGAAGDVKK
jgi:hypothetical protein